MFPGATLCRKCRNGFWALGLLLVVGNLFAGPVKLEFLPPPMDGGLISVGIYNRSGTLVRTLCRETDVSQLPAGDDGLRLTWDGKDDAGQFCPSGSYRARGVMVGDLGVEGIDFIGNDWITSEETPRFAWILKLAVNDKGELLLQTHPPVQTPLAEPLALLSASALMGDAQWNAFSVQVASGSNEEADVEWTATVAAPDLSRQEELRRRLPRVLSFSGTSANGSTSANVTWDIPTMQIKKASVSPLPASFSASPVIAAAPGPVGGVWVLQDGTVRKYFLVIVSTGGGIISHPGMLQNTLPPQPGVLVPVWLDASADGKLYVLYASPLLPGQRSPALQRVVCYDCAGLKFEETPRQLFSNDILGSDTYLQIASQLTFPDGKPFQPVAKISVRLVPNPLENDRVRNLEVAMRLDPQGAYLSTADGLPLCRISDAKNVLWSVLGRAAGSKELIVFVGDGAVVEEYKVGSPSQMMPFDAGSFLWKAPPVPAEPAPATPTPAK